MLNVICLVGRLTADPELRTTNTGVSTTKFTIAVDRDFVKQGEERQADFIDVVCWRQSAEFVNRYFHKGSWIAVTGSLQTRTYEDRNGVRRKAVEVIASSVSFCGNRDNSGSQGYGNAAPAPRREAQQPAPSFSNTDGSDLGDLSSSDDDLPF